VKLLRLVALAGLAASFLAAQAQEVKIGSPAPKLAVAKWLKGKEFNSFDPNKLYVVEFWATWCGPCKVVMPHLTELAKKHKDVVFTGVSVFEDQEKEGWAANVESFVKKNDKNMGYNVGADDEKKQMQITWMEAAKQDGIPASFVIQKGKVAWIGHPMEVETIIDQIKAGKYDMDAEAKKIEKAKEMEERMMKIFGPIAQAAQGGDFEKAESLIDKAITENPDLREELSMQKFSIMLAGGSTKLGTYVKDLAGGLFKDNALYLNEIAWTMIDEEEEWPRRDYPAALVVAERAVEASKGEDWMILDTLALAQFKNNLFKKAVETQEKAVKLMNKDKEAEADTKKEVLDRLERFKKAAAGG